MGLMDSLGIGGSFGDAVSGISNFIPGVSQYHSAESAREAGREANATNVGLSREANAFSAQQAQIQMDFQERMSNTSHQRQVADMRAAGLNPLLSLNSGASSPSGAMGSVNTPSVQPTPMDYSGFVSGAMDAVRMLQEVSESNSRIKLNKDSGDKARADAGLSRVKSDRESADAWIQVMKKRLFERLFSSAKSNRGSFLDNIRSNYHEFQQKTPYLDWKPLYQQ